MEVTQKSSPVFIEFCLPKKQNNPKIDKLVRDLHDRYKSEDENLYVTYAELPSYG